jgi:UDP-2,4-diacetamido-2,4,6-trideoxy-beta-L-altropyranose hydrolase
MMYVVIRADASVQIGSGHVIRCLTLAESLRDFGATVEFIARSHSGNLNDLVSKKGFKVHSLVVKNESYSQLRKSSSGYEQWLGVQQKIDADETAQVLTRKNKIDWLIVDHYALDRFWEDRVRPHTKKVMVIDDLANRDHSCDLLLDQNYTHELNRYGQLVSPETIQLLGPQFALLRNEFSSYRSYREKCQGAINRVFLFFGGSDPDNLTAIALKALSRPDLSHLSVCVLVGSANPHQGEVRALVQQHPDAVLYSQVDNVAELMAKADIAIGAGGTTTLERMAVGLPSIVITIAENQVAFTRELDRDGYLNWLGNADQEDENTIHDALLEALNDPNQLRDYSEKGKKLVDGMGAKIVTDWLINGPGIEALSARRASISDCLLYWYWANDPLVRKNAFNQQAISWEDHQLWFDKRLNDPDTILLLIECKFGPIGQVRFDYSGSFYTIDYSIAKQFRGLGLGKVMLIKAIDVLRQELPFILVGDVKGSNPASKRVFEQLGFIETDSPIQKGVSRFRLYEG